MSVMGRKLLINKKLRCMLRNVNMFVSAGNIPVHAMGDRQAQYWETFF